MTARLRVEPSPDITFEVSSGKPNSCPLRLYNSGTEHAAFKVKTTAPKKYCVRPNAGVIPPGKHVEVFVIPQVAKGADQTLANDLAGKCKDKFMIQSTTVQGDTPPTAELWAQVQPPDLQQTLLRCKFKIASSGGDGIVAIPEGGELSGSMLGSAAPATGINIDELDFGDVEMVKLKLTLANKEIQQAAMQSARKLSALQEDNAKLIAGQAAGAAARDKQPAAVAAGALDGFTPLFVALCALMSYVLGVYTPLMLLPH